MGNVTVAVDICFPDTLHFIVAYSFFLLYFASASPLLLIVSMEYLMLVVQIWAKDGKIGVIPPKRRDELLQRGSRSYGLSGEFDVA